MRPFVAGLTMALALHAGASAAQPYPSRQIRMIVSFAPGGTADALARPIAEKLQSALGQGVVVENKPGALTVIGADIVAKATPDGYTLYLMPGTHAVTPFLVRKVPFDPINDFSPISFIGTQGYVFIANAKQPFATLREMIAHAKSNPDRISIGVSDAVTLTAAATLKAQAGIDVTIVNYKGGGQVVQDVLGGQIDVGVGTPPVYRSFEKDGRLRALGVSVPSRLSFLPEVPTGIESGVGPAYDVQTWYALAGPAKIPRPIVERLHAEMAKILAEPEMQKRLIDFGIAAPADGSPEAALSHMKSYTEQMGRLMKAAGIKPES